jgi:transposase
MQEQNSAAFEIAELIMKGKQVVYVDESSFHRWLVPTKTWVTREMVLQMPSSRGKSFSVIGAISEKQGLVHYSILRESNTTETFASFTAELVEKIKGDAVVYMDNFSVHHSNLVKSQFNDRVMQRFLPAYTCTLNPIEKLWLVIKDKWRRAMIEA